MTRTSIKTQHIESKIPPQSIDLEEAVLGAIMIQGDCFDDVEPILKKEAFYVEKNMVIYDAISKLSKAKSPIDILTVTEQLKKTGELEAAGGVYRLTELTSRVTSVANVVFHARIIVEKFIKREVIRVCMEYIGQAYEEESDPFYLIDDIKVDVDEITSMIEEDDSEPFSIAIKNELKEKREQFDNGVKMRGISTGNRELDSKIGGLEGSCLYVLAAKEGGGKSARALALAKKAAEQDIEVDIFSLEMSQKNYVRRFIIESSSVLMNKYRNNDLSEFDWRNIDLAAGKLRQLPITIHDSSICSPNIIRRRLKKRIKKKGKPGLIIIDYVQLMKSDEKTGNREQEIASISRELKSISKEFDVPVIALAQINRESEKESGARRPRTAHLRESAALGNDADVVMFVYRPAYYFPYGEHPDHEYSPETITKEQYEIASELLIAKNRDGEPNQRVREIFIGGYSRFVSIPEYESDFKSDYQEPPDEPVTQSGNSDIKPIEDMGMTTISPKLF